MKLKGIISCFIFTFFLIIERQAGTHIPIPFDAIFSAFIVFTFVYAFCKILKPSFTFLFTCFTIGFIIPELTIRFIEGFLDSLIFLPILIIEIIAAILAWLLFKKKKFALSIIYFTSLCFITIFFKNECRHFFNYGNFYPKTAINISSNWSFLKQNKDTISNKYIGDKIMVLDFWNTSCPICYRKFPDFQKIYDKYSKNDKLFISSINVPIPQDTQGMAFNIIAKKGYRFPVLISISPTDSIFNITSFPIVLLVKNNKIIFRGSVDELENTLQSLIKTSNN